MTRISGTLAAGLLALAVSACGGAEHAEEAPPRPAVAVTTAAAEVTEMSERLEAGGVVAAHETAVLSSRLVATVASVRVKAGDRVRVGDVLVTLDSRDVAAQARQASASLSAAEQGLSAARTDHAGALAEQELAEAWHGRVLSLHERNSATSQELDEAEARLAGARARVGGAAARIEQAGATVAANRASADAAAAVAAFTTLRAPFNGVVTERLTDPGNLASPGTPLLRIDALGAPHVDVRVDEARAAYIRPGDRAEVLFDAPASEEGGGQVEGTVTEVARAVAADERAFTVKVSLPAGQDMRTGTFARVRFRGASRRALTIPASALRRQGQVVSVFVAQDGVAHLRLLQTGYAGADRVEVLAGLDPDEQVITAPPPGLQDGQPLATAAAGTGARR